jgi:hypothetical protein
MHKIDNVFLDYLFLLSIIITNYVLFIISFADNMSNRNIKLLLSLILLLVADFTLHNLVSDKYLFSLKMSFNLTLLSLICNILSKIINKSVDKQIEIPLNYMFDILIKLMYVIISFIQIAKLFVK